MKYIIFDAGPLISLTLSGMLGIIKKMANPDIVFIITPQVKKEVVDRAMTIKKYKLEAVQIANLIEKGFLKESSNFIKDEEISRETGNVLNLSRKLISSKSEKINLIQEGEASCLAFSKLCNQKNVIVIDERTTRLITESIGSLKEVMEKKLHMELQINKKELDYFKEFKYIRSSEMVFVAFKKGLIDLKKDRETLDALMYSLKFHGTAISSREIEQMKEIINLN
jgi:hypothetical protein